MGYQVLARKYRPQKFADVAGQDHVTRTLLNALEQQRTAHGYIFSGHRGIGKTTIARILAMAMNCRTEIGSAERPTPEPCGICDSCTEVRAGNAVDVIEIDAATNRGIDEIRELRDAARYAPARDRYKIYILDEAHQITDAAFNALLKTLEEPPPHVVFMMATTEPENIPQTIRSRCQHFSFHAVKFDDILAQLKMIAGQEDVNAEEAALALLAEAGDGSMRDALSIMDQAIASAPVEDGRPKLGADLIRDLMGSVPNAVFERLLEAVAQGQSAALMEQLNVLLNAGNSPSSLARQMVRYLRNALMAKLGGEQTELLQISADERARATRTAMLFSEEDLTRALQIVLRTFDDLNYRQEQRFHLELGLLKLIHAQRLLPLEELLSSVTGGATVKAVAGQMTRATGSMTTGSSTTSSSGSKTIGFSASWTPAATPAPSVAPPPATTASAAAMPIPVASPPPPPAPTPVLTPFEKPTQSMRAEPEPAPEIAAPSASTPAASSSQDTDAMRDAVVSALNEGGHTSAAQLLHSGRWTVDGSNLRIEVASMSKKMLALTVNAQAEKIIRQVLQKMNAPARFLVVPGESATNTSSSLPSSAPAGSAQQLAMENPLIKRAQEIFNAEVRSVLDLRTK
ncbi:MAG TPA: DNA polymerase III subunit gamma/tau [Terracidiphilus sp.]|nr:DNA polymerase III subunit gamma/tau [Terracidiphilus sp.]